MTSQKLLKIGSIPCLALSMKKSLMLTWKMQLLGNLIELVALCSTAPSTRRTSLHLVKQLNKLNNLYLWQAIVHGSLKYETFQSLRWSDGRQKELSISKIFDNLSNSCLLIKISTLAYTMFTQVHTARMVQSELRSQHFHFSICSRYLMLAWRQVLCRLTIRLWNQDMNGLSITSTQCVSVTLINHKSLLPQEKSWKILAKMLSMLSLRLWQEGKNFSPLHIFPKVPRNSTLRFSGNWTTMLYSSVRSYSN